MNMGSVTTPFGRRPMTLALVKRQQSAAEIGTGKTADKWRILRDASAAMDKLGLQSNSLALLDALLSFYPETELRSDAQLIVFPSNAQLSLRAHSMSDATIRRHLAILVDAGMIIRRDSANGKRFARKGREGTIESAYGLDLSPLLARAEELALIAQQVAAERATHKRLKESLTVCRRDVRKLITAAIEEGAPGDWQAVEDVYLDIVSRIPRKPATSQLADILDEMQLLHAEVVNRLEKEEKCGYESGNDAQPERHKQNSNPESINEFEPSSGKEQGAKSNVKMREESEQRKVYPLSMVLRACPTISDYGPGGSISSWRDLMLAAVVVRSMLGISPSAYQDACDTMGAESAAVAVGCILERANFINSAGGYLRDLTNRTKRGEFSLGPMIMAALRSNNAGLSKSG